MGKTNSSSTSSPPSPPLSPPRPEVTVTPLLPRPLPSRTSKRPLPLESSRDLMTDNQSSRTPSRPSKRSSMSEEWARNELLHDNSSMILMYRFFTRSLQGNPLNI